MADGASTPESGARQLIVRLYESGKSIPDISDLTGVPRSTVRNRLIKSGVCLRTRADGVRLAGVKISTALKGRTRSFTEDHKRKIARSRARWGEENAVGFSVKPSGYIEHTRGENKGRSVHVVVMEERLGRRLRPDEVVHHIDEDRANNDPNNLALMTRAGHTRHHRMIERIRKWQDQ